MPEQKPPRDAEKGNLVEKDKVVDSLRGMVETLVDHLRSHMDTENESRRTLDQLSQRLQDADSPEELEEISNEIASTCVRLGDITEQIIDQILTKQQRQLQNVIATVTDSVKTFASGNENLSNALGQEIKQIEEAQKIADPEEASKKMLEASNSLAKVSEKVKQTVTESANKMSDASTRVKHLEEELKRTKQESQRDGLTHLFNRGAFDEMMKSTIEGSSFQSPCALIMLDIDHFKKVNDQHGHLIGDALLIKLAKLINKTKGKELYAARYGGEEFCIIAGACSLTRANDIAEDLRERVKSARWGYLKDNERRSLQVTVSLGVTVFRYDDTPESVIARADEALYVAKSSGRDRVRTEQQLE